MHLLIDRERRDFIPATAFRLTHALLPTFCIAYFEPADGAPSGSSGWTKGTAAEQIEVQQAVLDAIPAQLPLWGWSLALPPLVTLFQNKLDAAAPLLELNSDEIAFAVSTFSHVLQLYLHAMIHARVTGQAFPSFAELYMNWLDSTVTIGGAVYPYAHHSETWAVQVVSHAYGKVGLIVWTNAATYYVQDNAYNRRLQLFLETLLGEAAAHMAAAVRAASVPADARR